MYQQAATSKLSQQHPHIPMRRTCLNKSPIATWKPPARMIKYPKPQARRSSAGGGREQPAAWLGPKTAQVLCFTVSRTLSRPPSPATRRVAAPVTRSKRRPTGCKYVWSRPPQRLPLGDGLDGLVDRRVVARRRVAAGRRGLLHVLRSCAGAGRLRHACMHSQRRFGAVKKWTSGRSAAWSLRGSKAGQSQIACTVLPYPG